VGFQRTAGAKGSGEEVQHDRAFFQCLLK